MHTYHISLIRCCGYYLFAAGVVRLLFEGSVYFFGKPMTRTSKTVMVARHCL